MELDAQTRNREAFDRHYAEIIDITGRQAWMVMKRAKQHDRDELVNIGLAAAFRVIGDYDRSRGYTLAQYLSLRVRGAMWDHIRTHSDSSRKTVERSMRVIDANDRFFVANGRRPFDGELAEILGVDEKTAAAMKLNAKNSRLYRINTLVREGETRNFELCDGITDPRSEDPTARIDGVDFLEAAVSCLKDDHRAAVIAYFYEDLTFKQIGHRMGVSQTCVLLWIQRALPRIRRCLEAKGLTPEAMRS